MTLDYRLDKRGDLQWVTLSFDDRQMDYAIAEMHIFALPFVRPPCSFSFGTALYDLLVALGEIGK